MINMSSGLTYGCVGLQTSYNMHKAAIKATIHLDSNAGMANEVDVGLNILYWKSMLLSIDSYQN